MRFYQKRTGHTATVTLPALLCCILALAGCGGARQTASIDWAGDKVRLRIEPAGSSLFSHPTVTCVSCKESTPPFPVSTDDRGVVEFYFPEARDHITTRFFLEAGGLDTALVLQPPPPEVATRQYKLLRPLTGRILVSQLAMVYRDTTMAEAVSMLEREDEANIFGEDEVYYFVHHPAFREPLLVLKSHAIRIR